MTTIIRKFQNNFNLPPRIKRLSEVVNNLWWVWNYEAQRFFKEIDFILWEECYHNPIVFLRKVDPALLDAVTKDRYMLEKYDLIMREFDRYMNNKSTWFAETYPQMKDEMIGYFSFEFGLHESLMVYAGGLGVLSGDHLKEASDLGMPLTAVGFLYTYGYFSQHITEDGWQEARNMSIDFNSQPLISLEDEKGEPIKIYVDLPGRRVYVRVYELRVGRVPLYLLQTNIPENEAADRQLTDRLYISDLDLRISQEILLGIGGVRALRALGCKPTAWHMNEGHAAFLGLERCRELIESEDITFAEAAEKVNLTNIFTTHTPVPAGNDEFPIWLVEKYFNHVLPALKLTRDEFINVAKVQQSWGGEAFSMPVLALRLSNYRNAVSELHGHVSRKMWSFLWNTEKEEEVPISYVTNGVHASTWLARQMGLLYATYLGADWLEHLDDAAYWNRAEKIPDVELWRVRRHLKRKLVAFMVSRARRQWMTTKIHPVQIVSSGVLLDPYALTIGFARRFATYKRASLLFRDYERVIRLATDERRPVQFVFAGKAHPADDPGKHVIQEVYRAVKDARFGGRLVFLEDYDMNVARYLVQGVDVWLNTPRRPREASGTSGEKAALNGVLNFSILDGWWNEGYNGKNGFAIGGKSELDDPNAQDDDDIASLYDTLENQIIPLYYDNRSADNIPVDWLAMVKENIRTLVPQFNMRRMVKEYMTQLYEPAILAGVDERNKAAKVKKKG